MIKQLTNILLLATALSATDLSQFINKQNCDQINESKLEAVCTKASMLDDVKLFLLPKSNPTNYFLYHSL
jgi:hypothetical protein